MKALPEDRTIIERAVAEVNDSTAVFGRFFFNKTLQSAMGLCSCIALASVASVACAGDEGAAQRMGNEAVAAVKAQRLDEAIALYREVVDRYPDTAVALHARERITFLSGLSHSVVSFPSRTARDLMVETARAVQRYRYSKGRYPDNLDALMPKMLNDAPIDPWGSPLQYERLESGYRLSCLGGDSRRGGEGIATDFVIVNGNFVSDPAHEAPF